MEENMKRRGWLFAVGLSVGLAGCVEDPQDPKTWIKKLGDPREGKQAIGQLVKLKDAAAVEPLSAMYQKTKDLEVLKALATFKDKRAVPLFVDSLDYTEDAYDAAAAAATALGEIRDAAAVEPLAKVLGKPLSVKSRANIVKLEAMKALVKIHQASPSPADAKAVAALIKVLETPADDQDFFLNQVAAQSLGTFGAPESSVALVRGLFMTGRGADIFQPCRAGLLRIGAPAVPALLDAFAHKHESLEADAKKYEFRPGVIEQKTALVLGDLRAKDAVPALVAQLKKPVQGDSHTGALFALGMIGDPSTTKELVAVLGDAKLEWRVRVSAAEALNLAGDPSALPALLNVAKTGDVVKEGQKYPDVRIAAAIAYGRLGTAAEAAAFQPVAAAEKAAKDVFDETMLRLEVGKKCGKDIKCYAAALDETVLAKQEKAAFMLSRLGPEALPILTKKLTTKEPIVRFAVLFGIGKIADKSATETLKALEEQIDLDKGKPPIKPLVDEMRAVASAIAGR
jgi:HEAT repeat protein